MMSVNITIAIPLEAVAALTQDTDPSKMADALATISKAAVEGIKALPYDIKPAATDQEEDNLSIVSFDSDAPAFAPRPSKKIKRDPVQPKNSSAMQIEVRDLKGGLEVYAVDMLMTMDNLKSLIQDRTGKLPDQQRLICCGKQLEDGRTFQNVCMSLHPSLSEG